MSSGEAASTGEAGTFAYKPAKPSPTRWPVNRWGALAVVVAAVIVWAVLPTAPNYDTATHLVWAHEIADGRMPDVKAIYSPTLHPLWLLAAFVAEDSGGGAALLQLVALLAFGIVIASAYRLAADVAGWIAGVIAAVATGSSFALLLLAFKAYVDLPFLAVVLTAVVVERAYTPARDRDLAMPILMFFAGLLRPEAWAIGLLLVALRLVPGRGVRDAGAAHGGEAVQDGTAPVAGAAVAADRAAVRDLILPAVIVIAAPILWALCDQALTGDPMHSLTGTQALAEELSRKTGLVAAPKQLVLLLSDLARPPIAAGGILGVILAVRFIGWRPLLVPLATLIASALGFLLIGALGLPLLQRYLELPAVLICAFSGVAGAILIDAARGRAPGVAGAPPESLGSPGATDRSPETSRPGAAVVGSAPSPAVRWLATAVLAVGVVGAGGYLVLKANSFRIVGQGVLREGRWQKEGADLLATLRVKERKARCGPVSLPTYRFVPELTLASGLDEGDVVSRATQLGGAGPQTTGIAITVAGDHAARERLGWAQGVPRATNAIPPGFTVVATRGPFVAAERCPAP